MGEYTAIQYAIHWINLMKEGLSFGYDNYCYRNHSRAHFKPSIGDSNMIINIYISHIMTRLIMP